MIEKSEDIDASIKEDNPCLDPHVVEKVGEILLHSMMLMVPVLTNYFLQKFLRRVIPKIVPPSILKANASNDSLDPPSPVKVKLRED